MVPIRTKFNIFYANYSYYFDDDDDGCECNYEIYYNALYLLYLAWTWSFCVQTKIEKKEW